MQAIGEPDTFEWNLDIESFIERASRHNMTCYFHNLKFDGHFIVDWMLKHGFRHTTERRLSPMTFKSLISAMGNWYSITVQWANGNEVEFRDSAKKLPMSVARIAQSFNQEESKGEIDYHAHRPVGYLPTPAEIDYLRRDINIISEALKLVVVEQGMKKLTVASDSLAEYKELVSSKWFDRTFPQLSEHMDAEIRRAYRGGWTYASPRFKSRHVGSGIVLDVNSLYPYVMQSRALPYGEPQYVEGHVEPTATHPLTIFSITFTAKLKKDHVPVIQIKGSAMFNSVEYLSEITEPTTLMVTNVDWELYNDHYDIHVLEYGGGWRFHAALGLFDTYIDKWSKIKQNSTGGLRELAKLHLNSLYGKFATNPQVQSKIPYIENGKVKFMRGEDETRPSVYTAMGVFITSYARDITIRAAQENFDTFAYADTDSLHLLRDDVPETIDVHPTKLGAWKLEYAFMAAFYVRAKFYLEQMADGTYHNACAGMDNKVSAQLTFADLVEGKKVEGGLKAKSVPGGIVLQDSPYEIHL